MSDTPPKLSEPPKLPPWLRTEAAPLEQRPLTQRRVFGDIEHYYLREHGDPRSEKGWFEDKIAGELGGSGVATATNQFLGAIGDVAGGVAELGIKGTAWLAEGYTGAPVTDWVEDVDINTNQVLAAIAGVDLETMEYSRAKRIMSTLGPFVGTAMYAAGHLAGIMIPGRWMLPGNWLMRSGAKAGEAMAAPVAHAARNFLTSRGAAVLGKTEKEVLAMVQNGTLIRELSNLNGWQRTLFRAMNLTARGAQPMAAASTGFAALAPAMALSGDPKREHRLQMEGGEMVGARLQDPDLVAAAWHGFLMGPLFHGAGVLTRKLQNGMMNMALTKAERADYRAALLGLRTNPSGESLATAIKLTGMRGVSSAVAGTAEATAFLGLELENWELFAKWMWGSPEESLQAGNHLAANLVGTGFMLSVLKGVMPHGDYGLHKRLYPELNNIQTRAEAQMVRTGQTLGEMPGIARQTNPLFRAGWEVDGEIRPGKLEKAAEGEFGEGVEVQRPNEVTLKMGEHRIDVRDDGSITVPAETYNAVRFKPGKKGSQKTGTDLIMEGKEADRFLDDLTLRSLAMRAGADLHMESMDYVERIGGQDWINLKEMKLYQVGLDGRLFVRDLNKPKATMSVDSGDRVRVPNVGRGGQGEGVARALTEAATGARIRDPLGAGTEVLAVAARMARTGTSKSAEELVEALRMLDKGYRLRDEPEGAGIARMLDPTQDQTIPAFHIGSLAAGTQSRHGLIKEIQARGRATQERLRAEREAAPEPLKDQGEAEGLAEQAFTQAAEARQKPAERPFAEGVPEEPGGQIVEHLAETMGNVGPVKGRASAEIVGRKDWREATEQERREAVAEYAATERGEGREPMPKEVEEKFGVSRRSASRYLEEGKEAPKEESKEQPELQVARPHSEEGRKERQGRLAEGVETAKVTEEAFEAALEKAQQEVTAASAALPGEMRAKLIKEAGGEERYQQDLSEMAMERALGVPETGSQKPIAEGEPVSMQAVRKVVERGMQPTVENIRAELGSSATSARRALKALQKMGLVEAKAPSRSNEPYTYHPVETAQTAKVAQLAEVLEPQVPTFMADNVKADRVADFVQGRRSGEEVVDELLEPYVKMSEADLVVELPPTKDRLDAKRMAVIPELQFAMDVPQGMPMRDVLLLAREHALAEIDLVQNRPAASPARIEHVQALQAHLAAEGMAKEAAEMQRLVEAYEGGKVPTEAEARRIHELMVKIDPEAAMVAMPEPLVKGADFASRWAKHVASRGVMQNWKLARRWYWRMSRTVRWMGDLGHDFANKINRTIDDVRAMRGKVNEMATAFFKKSRGSWLKAKMNVKQAKAVEDLESRTDWEKHGEVEVSWHNKAAAAAENMLGKDAKLTTEQQEVVDLLKDIYLQIGTFGQERGLLIDVGKGEYVPFQPGVHERSLRIPGKDSQRVWDADDAQGRAARQGVYEAMAKKNGMTVDEVVKRIEGEVPRPGAGEHIAVKTPMEVSRRFEWFPAAVRVKTKWDAKSVEFELLEQRPYEVANKMINHHIPRLAVMGQFGQDIPLASRKAILEKTGRVVQGIGPDLYLEQFKQAGGNIGYGRLVINALQNTITAGNRATRIAESQSPFAKFFSNLEYLRRSMLLTKAWTLDFPEILGSTSNYTSMPDVVATIAKTTTAPAKDVALKLWNMVRHGEKWSGTPWTYSDMLSELRNMGALILDATVYGLRDSPNSRGLAAAIGTPKRMSQWWGEAMSGVAAMRMRDRMMEGNGNAADRHRLRLLEFENAQIEDMMIGRDAGPHVGSLYKTMVRRIVSKSTSASVSKAERSPWGASTFFNAFFPFQRYFQNRMNQGSEHMEAMYKAWTQSPTHLRGQRMRDALSGFVKWLSYGTVSGAIAQYITQTILEGPIDAAETMWRWMTERDGIPVFAGKMFGYSYVGGVFGTVFSLMDPSRRPERELVHATAPLSWATELIRLKNGHGEYANLGVPDRIGTLLRRWTPGTQMAAAAAQVVGLRDQESEVMDAIRELRNMQREIGIGGSLIDKSSEQDIEDQFWATKVTELEQELRYYADWSHPEVQAAVQEALQVNTGEALARSLQGRQIMPKIRKLGHLQELRRLIGDDKMSTLYHYDATLRDLAAATRKMLGTPRELQPLEDRLVGTLAEARGGNVYEWGRLLDDEISAAARELMETWDTDPAELQMIKIAESMVYTPESWGSALGDRETLWVNQADNHAEKVHRLGQVLLRKVAVRARTQVRAAAKE